MEDVAGADLRGAAAAETAGSVFSDPWAVDHGHTDAAPAGVWRRGAALLVDVAIAWLILRVGDLLALPLLRWDLVARAFVTSFALVVPAAYFVLSHGTGGQTLGKRLVGVRVVDVAGNPLGYAQALGRLLATVLALAPLGLGLLLAAARRDKRGAHDLLAGTRVIVAEWSPE